MSGSEPVITIGVPDTLIYENDLYVVLHGDPQASDHNMPLYKLVSKVYGVIEMESTVLWRCLTAADEAEAICKAHTEAKRKEAVQAGDEEVPLLS